MDNQTTEIKDPWANMGNLSPQGPQNGEVSAENLKRAEEWTQAMQNPPAFSGEAQSQPTATAETPVGTPIKSLAETSTQLPSDAEQRNESIAEAEAILYQGPINAAAREKGIEQVVQSIKNFVYDGNGNPINQLLNDVSIDTQKELTDMAEEQRAIKQAENTFRTENINAPVATKKSEIGALSAIKDFKELIAEVETSPDYANLREQALKNGKSIWEEAIREYNVRDLTTLFDALGKQKALATQETPPKPEIPTEPESPQEPTEAPQETEAPQPKITSEPETPQPEIVPEPETSQPEIASEPIQPETQPAEPITIENQIENQSSTENPSPETDATASNGFLSQ